MRCLQHGKIQINSPKTRSCGESTCNMYYNRTRGRPDSGEGGADGAICLPCTRNLFKSERDAGIPRSETVQYRFDNPATIIEQLCPNCSNPFTLGQLQRGRHINLFSKATTRGRVGPWLCEFCGCRTQGDKVTCGTKHCKRGRRQGGVPVFDFPTFGQRNFDEQNLINNLYRDMM